MQTYVIKSISMNDPCYPAAFRQLKKPPRKIYVSGNTDLLLTSRAVLSVVGARRATSYGKLVTQTLVSDLAARGAVIVSGLARGVDYTAHTAALGVGGATIAVLPSDLNNIYPSHHSALARQILKSGGLLISEHASNESVQNFDFVNRNRLIAALCSVLLVPEASLQSGTVHTIKFAQDLNKDIAAVPGNITNPLSEGSNKLLFDGAHVVLCYQDLMSLLKMKEAPKNSPQAQNEIEVAVLKCLANRFLSTNSVVEITKYSVAEVSTYLTLLEIRGVIEQTNDNLWRIKS